MKTLPLALALALVFSGCTRRPAVVAMLDSTVQVLARVTLVDADGQSQEAGWVCSGFVVDHRGGVISAPRSLIATANHCLDGPPPGTSIPTPDGALLVVGTTFEIRTAAGRACPLTVAQLGDWSTGDVAMGIAACDAGPVAVIADRAPTRGEPVFVSGHPLGVWPAMVTQGLASGWTDDGYLLLSCPAFGGNSGGPVFNASGQVVGVLVRGSREYPQLTLSVPLSSLVERRSAVGAW